MGRHVIFFKHVGKRPVEKYEDRRKGGINLHLRKMECKDEDWIKVT